MKPTAAALFWFACLCSFLVFLWYMHALYPAELTVVKVTHPPCKSADGMSFTWECVTSQQNRSKYSEFSRQRAEGLLKSMLARIETTTMTDQSGDYVIVENLLTPRSWTRLQEVRNDVTLVTQCTSNHLHYLSDVSARWGGPVSVALFTTHDDLVGAMHALVRLVLCARSVKQHVALHLAMPRGTLRPGDLRPARFLGQTVVCDGHRAEGLASDRGSLAGAPLAPRGDVGSNFQVGAGMQYPINMLRNLALRGLATRYLFYLDVDLFFSHDLRANFIRDVTAAPENGEKIAYVVPAFEYMASEDSPPSHHLPSHRLTVSSNKHSISNKLPFPSTHHSFSSHKLTLPANKLAPPADKRAFPTNKPGIPSQDLIMPLTKPALLGAWRQYKVRPFQIETCYHCQTASQYTQWRTLPRTGGKMSSAYRVQFKPGYEPYYIAKAPVPLYDERFKGFGRDRQSQECELYLAGYEFYVLSSAFLLHDGFKVFVDYSQDPARARQHRENRVLFQEFHIELKRRYPGAVGNCTWNYSQR